MGDDQPEDDERVDERTSADETEPETRSGNGHADGGGDMPTDDEQAPSEAASKPTETTESDRTDDETAGGDDQQNSTEESAEGSSELTELRAELEATRDRVDTLETKFEDYRRRNDREHEEIKKYAVEDMASEMLNVRDMLEDAIEFEDLASDTENRLQMVITQFDQILTSGSIERIEPEQGEPYDNTLHRMTDKVKAKNHDENDVVRVLEIGYRTHDRVIRPASVQVAAGGSD